MRKHLLFLAFGGILWAQAPVAQQSPTAPSAMPPETVIATVNGANVTAGDVLKMLETSPPEFTALFRQNPKMAIQQYFVMRELSVEGEKKKLADKAPLKDKLEAIRSYLIAQEVVNLERNGFQVSEKAMEEFYRDNQARYSQAKVKVIGIRFLPPKPKGTTADEMKLEAQRALFAAQYPGLRSQDEAMARAGEVIKKLRAGGDFEKLCEQYSDDQDTKPMGGEFGWVKGTSAYPEAFKKTALALAKPGDVSEPTRVEFMLYVMRLEEKKVQPLDEVREPIIQELRSAHFVSWFNALTAKYDLSIKNVDFFTRPGAAAPAKPSNPPAPANP